MGESEGMKAIESYHDICKEVDILEVRIKDLEYEHDFLYSACFNGDRKPIMGLNIILERMKAICETVEIYSTILQEKERTRKEIEQRIGELESIDYKVCYLRDIKSLSLQEIAIGLGYSLIWVKKISARNKTGLSLADVYYAK
jgi:hypothetical protein